MNELNNREIRLIKRLLLYPELRLTFLCVPLINLGLEIFLDMLGYVLYHYSGPDYAENFSIYLLAFIVVGIIMIFIPGMLMNSTNWLNIRKKLGGGPSINLGQFESASAISRTSRHAASVYGMGDLLSRSDNEFISRVGKVENNISAILIPRIVKNFISDLANDEVVYVAERTNVKTLFPGTIFASFLFIVFIIEIGLNIYCWNVFL